MIELRHDCSASDAESNPIIRRKMETTVVYRLRVSETPDLNMNAKMSTCQVKSFVQIAPQNPLTEPCRDQMDKKFIWNLHLDVTGVRWVQKF